MAITLANLVDIACLLAGPAGIKQGPTAELLVPRILTWVAQRAAADANRRALVTSTLTLTLANGEGALPATVLVEFMDQSAVADPADDGLARKMRWQPKWSEFIRPLDQTLGYYTVKDGTFYLTRPGEAYAPGAGMDGDIKLTTPTRPVVSGGSVTTPAEIEQEIILVLVAALRGDWQQNPVVEVAR